MPTASLNNRMRNKNRMAGISQQAMVSRLLHSAQNQSRTEEGEEQEEYRPSMAERAGDVGGKALKKGGQMGETAGKSMQTAGKGAQVTGRGAQVVGKALSGTKVGAMIGAPLATAGKGMEATGKGIDKAGKATKKASKSAKEASGKISDASRLSQLKNQAKSKLNKKKKEEKTTGYGNPATSGLLKQTWLSIFYTGGLSIIFATVWIDAHIFLKFVFGKKLFCELGDEWIPKQLKATIGSMVGKKIGLAEVMGAIILNIICGIIIFGFLALIVMIASFLSMGWWDKLLMAIKVVYNLGFGTLTALYKLFGGLLS